MKYKSSLCHTRWDCKYHIVWIPKFRRKVLFGKIRACLGEVFHRLANQRESEILEGHLCKDHVHIYIAIPPKYSVAQVVGFMKGKSAIHIPVKSKVEQEGIPGRASEHVDTLFRPSGEMKR